MPELKKHPLKFSEFKEIYQQLLRYALNYKFSLFLSIIFNSALCRPVIEPMLPKSQYKMSMFFPVPETESAHVIGESTMKWEEWRTIPGAGEDALYILWRWQDCCNSGG